MAKESGLSALLRRMLTVVTKSIQPLAASLSQLKWVFKLGNFLLWAGSFNLQATAIPQLINLFIF